MIIKMAVAVCDVTLAIIGLNVAAILFVLIMNGSDWRCRISWDDVAEYGVLADLCKDDGVRRALLAAEWRNREARFADGSTK